MLPFKPFTRNIPIGQRQQHLLAPCRPITRCCICGASVREHKDPKRFETIDAAREYLHQRERGSGAIAGILNWLSNSAFGAGQQGTGLNPGRLYQQWLLHQHKPQQWQHEQQQRQQEQVAESIKAANARPDAVSNLAVLMFMSEQRVRELVVKYPKVLSMPFDEVARRLLLLKQLLPNCDVARMVEQQPSLLLGCDAKYLAGVVQPCLAALTAGLPGADIAEMIQEDPRLIFEDLQSSQWCSLGVVQQLL
eukprot:GHRR01010718.1.p1 GENE.GHRR01010718.1~~GHRR01010718.1.p1  ORF type:complete len:250 (+),score=72.58 GHRR01010718.1:126-875(+)